MIKLLKYFVLTNLDSTYLLGCAQMFVKAHTSNINTKVFVNLNHLEFDLNPRHVILSRCLHTFEFRDRIAINILSAKLDVPNKW